MFPFPLSKFYKIRNYWFTIFRNSTSNFQSSTLNQKRYSDVLRQIACYTSNQGKGIGKIREIYMKKLSLTLHKVGMIEDHKDEGFVVTGGYVHVNQVRILLHYSIIFIMTIINQN